VSKDAGYGRRLLALQSALFVLRTLDAEGISNTLLEVSLVNGPEIAEHRAPRNAPPHERMRTVANRVINYLLEAVSLKAFSVWRSECDRLDTASFDFSVDERDLVFRAEAERFLLGIDAYRKNPRQHARRESAEQQHAVRLVRVPTT